MADIILVDLERLRLVIGTADGYRDNGLRADEVRSFPRLGGFFYICRSLSLERSFLSKRTSRSRRRIGLAAERGAFGALDALNAVLLGNRGAEKRYVYQI